MDYKELKDFEEVVDYIVELIGRKFTQSMIRRKLREFFPGIKIKICNYLHYKAKRKITELYGIDPQHYKGTQISFYEGVIRNPGKVKDKLVAAERLDKLFGLEHVSGVDPSSVAEKIQLALKKIDDSVKGEPINDEAKNNSNEGGSKVDAETTKEILPTPSLSGEDIEMGENEDKESRSETLKELKITDEEKNVD